MRYAKILLSVFAPPQFHRLISVFDSLCVNLSTSGDADGMSNSGKGNAVNSPIATSWPPENNNGHASTDDTLLRCATHHGDASGTALQAPRLLAGLNGSANGGPAAGDQRETTRSRTLSQFVAHHERIDDIRLGQSDRAAQRVHTRNLMAQLGGILATVYPINGPIQARND